MKRLPLLIVLLLATPIVFAQKKENVYTTVGGEAIFSFASINDGSNELGSVLRFSPVFNFQNNVHFDQSDNFGIFTGLNARNVGFIYDIPGTGTRKKHRTYTLGIPVAIKVGDLTNMFFYGGYEIEFPFNYKEKTFQNEEKVDKFSVWFSDRTPSVYHTVFGGIQFPGGANLKFKYYLTNFFNQGFTETDPVTGIKTQPYQNMKVNVFYFALSVTILKGKQFYYSKDAQARRLTTRDHIF